MRKRFIIDVDMVLNIPLSLCKTLKLIWNEWVPMLEKTVHFFNIDLAEDTLHRDIPRYQKQEFAHVLLIVVLRNYAKFTVMHLHRSLFSTCNLQLYWKRDVGIHIFRLILQNFSGTTLLRKNTCELVLKG